MIDPTKITNYNLTIPQLQEMILFWVCAAGKNGITSARCLDKLLNSCQDIDIEKYTPFQIVEFIAKNKNLAHEMQKCGIGCYNNKSKTFLSLIQSNLDLQKCSVSELEAIPGIGPKTARCFLIHTRRDQNYAGLDTHVLKFLRDKGHSVPKSTPVGKKYLELEKIFLAYTKESGKSVADFDLEIWNYYRAKRTA